jgi:hypothetical protein
VFVFTNFKFADVNVIGATALICIFVLDFWWQTICGAALLIGYLLFITRIEKKELEKITSY